MRTWGRRRSKRATIKRQRRRSGLTWSFKVLKVCALRRKQSCTGELSSRSRRNTRRDGEQSAERRLHGGLVFVFSAC